MTQRAPIRTAAAVTVTALLTVAGLLTAAGGPAGAVPAPPTRAAKATSQTACAAATVTPGAGKRARYVWVRLLRAGYSPAAAAGVLGNLDYDSGFAPMAFGTTADRVGLVQWPRDRWTAFRTHVIGLGGNPWSLRRQVNFLIREMAADPGEFRHEKYAAWTNPQRASMVFHDRFNPSGVDDATVLATRGAKAQRWFDILSVKTDIAHNFRLTYGSPTPCAPPAARTDRCPRPPRIFLDKFRNDTGFEWDDMSDNARRMSRCVYVNFPHITFQGTYNGHMPTWSQAIDFMMPSGCQDTDAGPITTSDVDEKVGNRLARYLFENSARFGVDYLIWRDTIRNPGERPEENVWTPVANWRTDGYNNGGCTNTHYDHVHTSVYPDVLSASVLSLSDAEIEARERQSSHAHGYSGPSTGSGTGHGHDGPSTGSGTGHGHDGPSTSSGTGHGHDGPSTSSGTGH